MRVFAAIPLLLAAGAAIDFARFNGFTNTGPGGAGCRSIGGSCRQQNAPMPNALKLPRPALKPICKWVRPAPCEVKAEFKVEDERMVSSAELVMPTSFMALGGIDELEASSLADVGIAIDKKAEVALGARLFRIYEGSDWRQVKYIAMKEAATRLVKILQSPTLTK